MSRTGLKTVFKDNLALSSVDFGSVLRTVWSVLIQSLCSFFIPVCVILFGVSANGNAILFLTLASLHINENSALDEPLNETESRRFSFDASKSLSLEALGLKNVVYHILAGQFVAFSFYFIFGGILHYHFYVKQRDQPEKWKCQPYKFLPAELELDEIRVGCRALLWTNLVSGIVSCYISNAGTYSTVYFRFRDYSWWWTILQYPAVFLYQDYITYWMHWLYHTPVMYKWFHKMHHKYKQPTAFSVTAMHPLELVHMQCMLIVPAFTIPVHWTTFTVIAFYTYYHGVIQHSGINFKSQWWQPWQPDCMFHDNHHQYFHVNYGFNCYFWDILHGTYRKKDRIYSEDIYYGKGKPLASASESELQLEIEERKSENPTAYRSNQRDYELEDEDLKMLEFKPSMLCTQRDKEE